MDHREGFSIRGLSRNSNSANPKNSTTQAEAYSVLVVLKFMIAADDNTSIPNVAAIRIDDSVSKEYDTPDQAERVFRTSQASSDTDESSAHACDKIPQT
jgi:hypothetical protein